MSQNKMAVLVWGLCTGNHWEIYWFTVIAFIKSKKGKGEIYTVQLNPYERIFVRNEAFQSAFLLEVISHHCKVFTTSYCCYLMVSCPKCYEQRYI